MEFKIKHNDKSFLLSSKEKQQQRKKAINKVLKGFTTRAWFKW